MCGAAGGVINAGVSERGQEKGSLAGLAEPAETQGPPHWSTLRGEQMFSLRGEPSSGATFSCLEVRSSIRGAVHGTFRRQTLQLWYNNILIMVLDPVPRVIVEHPTPLGWASIRLTLAKVSWQFPRRPRASLLFYPETHTHRHTHSRPLWPHLCGRVVQLW
jgi:hypothetical protein